MTIGVVDKSSHRGVGPEGRAGGGSEKFAKRFRAAELLQQGAYATYELTARTADADRIDAIERGADAYLAKPFDRRELRAVLDGVMTRQRRLLARATEGGTPAISDEAGLPFPVAASMSARDRSYIERVYARIEKDLEEPDLTVEDLAAALGQTRVTLYRRVKHLTGRSPSELIREARLQRARSLLEEKSGSVSEVAYAVGFRSLAHFSNAFQARFEVRSSDLAA